MAATLNPASGAIGRLGGAGNQLAAGDGGVSKLPHGSIHAQQDGLQRAVPALNLITSPMPKPKSPSPLDALEKLQQTISRKTPVRKSSHLPQMSLPLWPEAVRGIPNAILRGALFSVTQRRPMFRKLVLLTTVDGIEIRFKGEGFNQTDLDLCEMLLHLAREQPLGRRVDFTARSMLKTLGRGTGKTQHEQLKEEISRLASGLIEISWPSEDGGRLAFGGTLVKYARDEQPDGTHRHIVTFDEQLLALYEAGYSHIDWHQRQALGANNLAKWLHGFYATHAAPLPYRVETIRGLCGSKMTMRSSL